MSSIFPRQPSFTSYEQILDKPLSFKGIISVTYSALTALSPSSISDIKSQWESELGEPICDKSWESALSRVHGSSVCARHELLQFKTLHRIHWTKLRLSKRFSDVNPQCDRCKCNPASHNHMFWSCPKLDHYWASIFDTMSGSLRQPISPSPLIGLFGVAPVHLGLTKAQSNSVALLILLARRLILVKWKDCKPRTFPHWVKEVLYSLKLLSSSLNSQKI